MPTQPAIETPRLRLRPFALEDAERLATLAGAREIADTTISIPHPYPVELAVRWIREQSEVGETGTATSFAIEFKQEPGVIGGIGLRGTSTQHAHTELGMWIGVPWWGRGYALEATRAVLDHAFRGLQLNRVCAHHMVRNPASGRVLLKAGFQREGLLRQAVCKWGNFEDVVVLGILRAEWLAQEPTELSL